MKESYPLTREATDAQRQRAGNGHGHSENSTERISVAQEMSVKLKHSIDNNGRYAYKLNDFATGFAAGKDISVAEARAAIEAQFERHHGYTLKAYQDERFNARKAKSQEQGMSH